MLQMKTNWKGTMDNKRFPTHSTQVRIHFADHSLHTEFSGAKLIILLASQTTEADITFPLLQSSPHCKRFKTDYNLQVILSSIT
jgi:hypothetical protein